MSTMLRRWRYEAARVVLVLVALFYSPETNSLGSIASAFLPREGPRGKFRHRQFRHIGSDTNRCHPQKETRMPLIVGMFPPLQPSFDYDEEVVFYQRATNTRIIGKDELERSIRQWEDDFRFEVDAGNDANYEYEDMNTQRLSAKASKVRKFSYSALLRLFGDAIATGKLRVPLACIEGTSTYEFRESESDGGTNCIVSITEDLAYAQDLNRGALSNRLCARDLQFFLEVARKPLEYAREGIKQERTENEKSMDKQQYEYWEDLVSEALPWRSVPGMMDPMYIESQSEDDLDVNLPLIFGTFSVVLVLLFANWVAPNLIGQSLFGPPSYIVPPSELNDIIQY